jgi:recombination protein RecT
MANKGPPPEVPESKHAQRQQQPPQAQQIQRVVEPGVSALDFIQKRKADFLRVIPQHLNGERMLRIAEGMINRTPDLRRCTAASIVRSVMEASQMGLEPGVLGDGWLIPFNVSIKDGDDWISVKEAQFIPGYQGIVKLTIQSGAVASLNVGAAYWKDEFDYALGSSPFVKHKPSLEPRGDDVLIAVYCVVKLVTGGKQVTVMSKPEVDKIKARSRAGGNKKSPWNTDYEQMAIKTVIKRACKNVPKAPQVSKAIEYDNRREVQESVKDLFELPAALPGEVESKQQDTAEEVAEALGGPAKPVGDKPEDWGLDKDEPEQRQDNNQQQNDGE